MRHQRKSLTNPITYVIIIIEKMEKANKHDTELYSLENIKCPDGVIRQGSEVTQRSRAVKMNDSTCPHCGCENAWSDDYCWNCSGEL